MESEPVVTGSPVGFEKETNKDNMAAKDVEVVGSYVKDRVDRE